jgi:hypothetical protein
MVETHSWYTYIHIYIYIVSIVEYHSRCKYRWYMYSLGFVHGQDSLTMCVCVCVCIMMYTHMYREREGELPCRRDSLTMQYICIVSVSLRLTRASVPQAPTGWWGHSSNGEERALVVPWGRRFRVGLGRRLWWNRSLDQSQEHHRFPVPVRRYDKSVLLLPVIIVASFKFN